MEQAVNTACIENFNDIHELVQMSIGTNKGSWWADPDFGSELYLLRESGKVDGKTAGTFKRLLQECLEWLVEDGIVKKINFIVERTGKCEISYLIEITQPNGSNVFIKDVWNGVSKG